MEFTELLQEVCIINKTILCFVTVKFDFKVLLEIINIIWKSVLFEKVRFGNQNSSSAPVLRFVQHCDVSSCVAPAAGGLVWNTGTGDKGTTLQCDDAVNGGLSSSSGC